MKKFLLGMPVLALTLVATTCDTSTNDPSSCGEDLGEHEYNITPWNKPTWNVYTEGTNRVFQIGTPLIENVCPDEHIKVAFNSTFKLGSTRVTHTRIKYRYSIFGGEFVASKTIGTDLESFTFPPNSNFGIKQAFDGIPGSFWIYFEWIISDYQDVDLDIAYFKSVLWNANYQVDWKKFKTN